VKGALSDRLMEFTAAHSSQIAEQWYKTLSTNAKTSAFQSMPKEACLRHAAFIYKNLGEMFFSENLEKAVSKVLDIDGFVEDHFARNIPLEQVIYGLILKRRHLWLFAEFQALFEGVEDLMQMLESVNRVLIVFDYIIYLVATKYQLMRANHPK
jgi:hypothetical protein